MWIKENVQSGTRLDYLEFMTSKKRPTIRTWFWRKWKSILNNVDFNEYLIKYKKNERDNL